MLLSPSEDGSRRIAARGTADAAARMRAGTAKIQPVDRHSVLRGTANGPHKHELVERQFAVMPMAPGDVEFALDIRRRQ